MLRAEVILRLVHLGVRLLDLLLDLLLHFFLLGFGHSRFEPVVSFLALALAGIFLRYIFAGVLLGGVTLFGRVILCFRTYFIDVYFLGALDPFTFLVRLLMLELGEIDLTDNLQFSGTARRGRGSVGGLAASGAEGLADLRLRRQPGDG